MQRIERYGVIALVFLLVTIVAVSLWGEQKKAGGLFQFLKRDSKSAQVDRLVADAGDDAVAPSRDAATRDAMGRTLPLSPEPSASVVPPALRSPDVSILPEFHLGALQEPFDDDRSVVAPEPVPAVVDLPPAARPTPPPTPVVAKVRSEPSTYTIRSGDTLSEIAQRELGTVRRLQELRDLNPGVNPRKLVVGNTLRLPGGEGASSSVAEASAEVVTEPPAPANRPAARATSGSTGTRGYTIRSGDTLSQIAQRELGTVRRMAEIVELNPTLDPDRLLAGRTLVLPVDASAPRETRVASATPTARPARSRTGSKVR